MDDVLAAMEDGRAASQPPAISCRVFRARKSVNGGVEAECNGSVALRNSFESAIQQACRESGQLFFNNCQVRLSESSKIKLQKPTEHR